MSNIFHCLWKKVVYSCQLSACKTYFHLSQQAEKENNISQAIQALDGALDIGKKALDTLSDDKAFPAASETQKVVEGLLKDMLKHRELLYCLNISKN